MRNRVSTAALPTQDMVILTCLAALLGSEQGEEAPLPDAVARARLLSCLRGAARLLQDRGFSPPQWDQMAAAQPPSFTVWLLATPEWAVCREAAALVAVNVLLRDQPSTLCRCGEVPSLPCRPWITPCTPDATSAAPRNRICSSSGHGAHAVQTGCPCHRTGRPVERRSCSVCPLGRSAPASLRAATAAASPWSAILSFAAARAFAASLLSLPLPGTVNVNRHAPDLSDVLADDRWAASPLCLPMPEHLPAGCSHVALVLGIAPGPRWIDEKGPLGKKKMKCE